MASSAKVATHAYFATIEDQPPRSLTNENAAVFSTDVYVLPEGLERSYSKKINDGKKAHIYQDAYSQYYYNAKSVLARTPTSDRQCKAVAMGRRESTSMLAVAVVFVIVLVTVGGVFAAHNIVRENASTSGKQFPEEAYPPISPVWSILEETRFLPILADVDLYGDDIRNGIANPTLSAVACARACAANPACTHWTWIQPDAAAYQPIFFNACWLKAPKRGVSSMLVIPQRGVYSGVVRQKGELLRHAALVLGSPLNNRAMYEDVDLPGNDLNDGVRNKKNAASICASGCRAHPHCTHWSWVKNHAPGYKADFFLSCWYKTMARTVQGIPVARREGIYSGVARRKSDILAHVDARLAII